MQPPPVPGGDPDLDLRPQQVLGRGGGFWGVGWGTRGGHRGVTVLFPCPQARWLRGAVGRWALGAREGPGAPPEPPPSKPGRGSPEEPPEYAEIRVK